MMKNNKCRTLCRSISLPTPAGLAGCDQGLIMLTSVACSQVGPHLSLVTEASVQAWPAIEELLNLYVVQVAFQAQCAAARRPQRGALVACSAVPEQQSRRAALQSAAGMVGAFLLSK